MAAKTLENMKAGREKTKRLCRGSTADVRRRRWALSTFVSRWWDWCKGEVGPITFLYQSPARGTLQLPRAEEEVGWSWTSSQHGNGCLSFSIYNKGINALPRRAEA